MNSYTKLRSGNWGIRATSQLSIGAIASVTKKSGETKSETVGNLVWSGNGVWLYAISESRSSTRRSYSGGRRTGCSCGSREDSYGQLIPSDRNCSSCEHDA